MGIVPPSPNFLLELRKACDSKGVLLIFDEVITGFRLSKGELHNGMECNLISGVSGKLLAGVFQWEHMPAQKKL